MTQYILTYLGGDQPASPEVGKQHVADYQTWLATLGDAAIAPMVHFKNTQTALLQPAVRLRCQAIPLFKRTR